MKKTKTINLEFLFKIYSMRKQYLTPLRLWLIARFVLDEKGTGCVDTNRLCARSCIKKKYFRRKCIQSGFFREIGRSTYYVSSKNLHRKFDIRRSVNRGERKYKLNKYFKNKKSLVGYITKCFFENDLDERYEQITNGRISVGCAASRLEISENTVRSNLRASDAKKFDNIKFLNVRFENKKEFSSWLLENADKIVDGKKVEDYFPCFFIRRLKSHYQLCVRKPHIFKFTGVYLDGPYKRGKVFNLGTSKFAR